MISQIMDYCKNHFARSIEYGKFEIVSDGIQGSFHQKYVAGQYLWVKASLANNGVYKVTDVESTKLTLDATLNPENVETICIFGCSPPSGFLALVTDIENFVQNNGTKDGISSEKIDDYSIAFSSGGGWADAFKTRLGQYRRMYDADEKLRARYNAYTKGYY